MIAALVAGGVFVFVLGLTVGLWIAKSKAPDKPAPTYARPRDVQYRIERDKKLLWHGTDGQIAKQWWEHAQAQSGPCVLTFSQDGILRDTVTLR